MDINTLIEGVNICNKINEEIIMEKIIEEVNC